MLAGVFEHEPGCKAPDYGPCTCDKIHASKETVNHPSHYGGDVVYEAIKVIQAWELNFSLGSVLKYICRAGKKDGADELEDLKKARWYLDAEIKARDSRRTL